MAAADPSASSAVAALQPIVVHETVVKKYVTNHISYFIGTNDVTIQKNYLGSKDEYESGSEEEYESGSEEEYESGAEEEDTYYSAASTKENATHRRR